MTAMPRGNSMLGKRKNAQMPRRILVPSTEKRRLGLGSAKRKCPERLILSRRQLWPLEEPTELAVDNQTVKTSRVRNTYGSRSDFHNSLFGQKEASGEKSACRLGSQKKENLQQMNLTQPSQEVRSWKINKSNEVEQSNAEKKQQMTAYKKCISQNKEREVSRFGAKDFRHNTPKTKGGGVISNKVPEAPILIMSSSSNKFRRFTQHNKDENIKIGTGSEFIRSVGSNNVLTRSDRSEKSTSSMSIPQVQTHLNSNYFEVPLGFTGLNKDCVQKIEMFSASDSKEEKFNSEIKPSRLVEKFRSKHFGSETKGERNDFDNPESYSCVERKRNPTQSNNLYSKIPKYEHEMLQGSSQSETERKKLSKRLELHSEEIRTVCNSGILKPITLQNSTELCETKVNETSEIATRPSTTVTICDSILTHKFKSVTHKDLENCKVSKNNFRRSQSTEELRTTNTKLSNDSVSAEKCVMKKVTHDTGEKASGVPLKILHNFDSSIVESDSSSYAKTGSFKVTKVDDNSCVNDFDNIGNETTQIKFTVNSSIIASLSEKSNVFSKSSSLQKNITSDIGEHTAVPTQVNLMCNTIMPKPETCIYPVNHLKMTSKENAIPNYESSSLLNIVPTHSTLQDTSLFAIKGCRPNQTVNMGTRNSITVATQTDLNEPSGIDVGFINTALKRVFTLCQSHQEEINAIIQRQSNIIHNEISNILSVINEKENNNLHNLILEQNNQPFKVQQKNKCNASKTLDDSASSTPLRRSLRIAAQNITLTPSNTTYKTPVGSFTKRAANLENSCENTKSGSSNTELQKSQTEYKQLRYSFRFLKTPQTSKQSSKKKIILRTPKTTPNRALSQRIHDQLQSLYD
ncbi:uncharacterized protein [Periplaneta americana]